MSLGNQMNILYLVFSYSFLLLFYSYSELNGMLEERVEREAKDIVLKELSQHYWTFGEGKVEHPDIARDIKPVSSKAINNSKEKRRKFTEQRTIFFAFDKKHHAQQVGDILNIINGKISSINGQIAQRMLREHVGYNWFIARDPKDNPNFLMVNGKKTAQAIVNFLYYYGTRKKWQMNDESKHILMPSPAQRVSDNPLLMACHFTKENFINYISSTEATRGLRRTDNGVPFDSQGWYAEHTTLISPFALISAKDDIAAKEEILRKCGEKVRSKGKKQFTYEEILALKRLYSHLKWGGVPVQVRAAHYYTMPLKKEIPLLLAGIETQKLSRNICIERNKKRKKIATNSAICLAVSFLGAGGLSLYNTALVKDSRWLLGTAAAALLGIGSFGYRGYLKRQINNLDEENKLQDEVSQVIRTLDAKIDEFNNEWASICSGDKIKLKENNVPSTST
jgi:hypothetical protein